MNNRSQANLLRMMFLEAGALSSSVSSDVGGGEDSGRGNNPGFYLFPAIYNNAGTIVSVSYISELTNSNLITAFGLAGYANEDGFVMDNTGVISYVTKLLTSVTVPGAIPFGTVEYLTFLTKDRVTNLSRYVVRLGP